MEEKKQGFQSNSNKLSVYAHVHYMIRLLYH